jgi:hypothetical protein
MELRANGFFDVSPTAITTRDRVPVADGYEIIARSDTGTVSRSVDVELLYTKLRIQSDEPGAAMVAGGGAGRDANKVDFSLARAAAKEIKKRYQEALTSSKGE